MFDWLAGKRNRKHLPEYSALRSTPSRGLPPDLKEAEDSESYATRRENLQSELRKPPRRPPDDEPLFMELLEANGSGVVYITLPPEDGGRCLPVFSTPFRAFDYVQTLLPTGPAVRYLRSSPLQLATMLHDIEAIGIKTVALDRCSRCSIFTTVGAPMTSDDLIGLWAIFKGTQLVRGNLYFSYALEAARAGRIEIARDVALETVGHVDLEDPRPHLLLGQLAVKLKDQELLREARNFLRFLKLDPWERKLDRVVQCGSPDFEDPAFSYNNAYPPSTTPGKSDKPELIQ
jgi:hypothetical protein